MSRAYRVFRGIRRCVAGRDTTDVGFDASQWKSWLPPEATSTRTFGIQKDSAMTWVTPSRLWIFPVTPMKLVVLISTEYSRKILSQTTRLTKPVSSSRVMKQTPEAVPGRWRQITIPA